MMTLDRLARSFLLVEIVSGMASTFREMFRPKATINYPYEKAPISPVWNALTRSPTRWRSRRRNWQP